MATEACGRACVTESDPLWPRDDPELNIFGAVELPIGLLTAFLGRFCVLEDVREGALGYWILLVGSSPYTRPLGILIDISLLPGGNLGS